MLPNNFYVYVDDAKEFPKEWESLCSYLESMNFPYANYVREVGATRDGATVYVDVSVRSACIGGPGVIPSHPPVPLSLTKFVSLAYPVRTVRKIKVAVSDLEMEELRRNYSVID